MTLNIKQATTTAHRAQADGQTERVNAVVESYIRSYCNWEQDNWDRLLPCAEFAYNNSKHIATKVTLFFANQGWHPRAILMKEPGGTPLEEPAAATHAEEMMELFETLTTTLNQT